MDFIDFMENAVDHNIRYIGERDNYDQLLGFYYLYRMLSLLRFGYSVPFFEIMSARGDHRRYQWGGQHTTESKFRKIWNMHTRSRKLNMTVLHMHLIRLFCMYRWVTKNKIPILQEFIDFLEDICRGYVGTTRCGVMVRNSMSNLHFRNFLSEAGTRLQLRHKGRVKYVHRGRLLIYKRAKQNSIKCCQMEAFMCNKKVRLNLRHNNCILMRNRTRPYYNRMCYSKYKK